MRSGGRHGRSTCPQSTARVPRSTEDSTSRGVGGIFDRGLQLLYNCSRTSLTSRTAAERHLAIFLIRSDESDTCDESRNRMTHVSDESATPGRDSSDRRVAAARRQSRGDSSDERNEHCRAGVEESERLRPTGRLVLYTSEKQRATSRTNWTWLIMRLQREGAPREVFGRVLKKHTSTRANRHGGMRNRP